MAMTERVAPSAPGLGWFDRLAIAVAPSWGLRRIVARRIASSAAFARIEAAEHNDTRANRWLISRLSPDSQGELDLQTARDRSRDIYQNDALGGVVESKVNHVIGTGHTPQARVRAKAGLIDDLQAEAINQQIEDVYDRWSPQASVSGRASLWMLSRLAARHNEFDGESFTVLSDYGRTSKPIPLALQVIDPERVETPPDKSWSDRIRLGIQYAANGEIEGYWVRRSHPGDTKAQDQRHDFVPAGRMLHVFEPWFAEQSRGLPWMVRALNRAKDAKDFDEATILAAQVEACFAGFVKPGTAGVMGLQAAIGAATDSSTSGGRIEDLVPGTLRYLNPGEEVQFGAPQRPGNTFVPFMEWNYRRVAAAINWPYEMVVKNWNGLSFAAGRLVLTDARKSTQVGQRLMREQWLSRVWERMIEESVIVGELDVDPLTYLSAPHEFQRHVWIAPTWDYALNPGEEVDADISEINANLATVEDKLGKRGYDLEQLIARRSREKRLFREAGLDEPTPVSPGRPPQSEPDDVEQVAVPDVEDDE